MKTTTFLTIAGLWSGYLAAQPQPVQWHHLDPRTDSVMGISTERTYRELLRGRKATPVLVAVIDVGVDINHEDLQSVIWTNPKEIAGNGQDDDHNSYVDDAHGWNFMGGHDSPNFAFYQEDETRIVARLEPRYATANRDSLPKDQQADYDLYRRAKSFYEKARKKVTNAYGYYSPMATRWENSIADLKKGLGVNRLDSALLRHPPTTDSTLLAKAATFTRQINQRGFDDAAKALAALQENIKELRARLDYGYNLQYDPQSLVGDHHNTPTEAGYGNADVTGMHSTHGTHVAGIIAANRTNQIGTRCIADHACIMPIRSTPDGDERDKDLANAIRYAVDNGARIINMSFGKFFSPERQVVDEAIRYADAKGVLLVHAAGNDHNNIDSVAFYPAATYPDGSEMTNMITVGASSRTNTTDLAASFSNYGPHSIDVYAPGVAILSTVPNNGYEIASGTSMASPVVVGIAAVLKSYFPQLTPQAIKRIILQSAIPLHTLVYKPGTKQLVDFASLSKSGGIVNLYEAVKLAITQTTTGASR